MTQMMNKKTSEPMPATSGDSRENAGGVVLLRCCVLCMLCGLLGFLASCESADCTLQNSVALHCGFYGGGKNVSLTDTLTVTTAGSDSVLLNRKVNAKDLVLPMSFWSDCDTLVLHLWGSEYDLRDTLFVEKTNTPHFEAPDCPTTMFHQITAARCTHQFIDSITVKADRVNYGEYEHIQIHLRTAD